MPRKPVCGFALASASSAVKMATKPSRATGFSRKSPAPFSRQVLRRSSLASPVNMTTCWPGWVRPSNWRNSIPSISGMPMSSTTTSTRSLAQQRQRLRVVFGREHVPPPACHFRKQLLDAGKEPRIVVHKQERFPFDDFAWHHVRMGQQSGCQTVCSRAEPFVHSGSPSGFKTALRSRPHGREQQQRPLSRGPNRRVGVPQTARQRRLRPTLS